MTPNQDSFGDIRAVKEFLEQMKRVIQLAELMQNLPDSPAAFGKADILQEVEAAGFQIDPWLEDFIRNASPGVVRDAIAVVEENRHRGRVRNPEGLLVSAIRNQWKANISG